MKLCTSCSAQFEDEYKRCLHCGAKLGAGAPLTSGARGGFAAPSTSSNVELVLIRQGSVAEVRQLSKLMDQMAIAHQVDVDQSSDDGPGNARTTLSLSVDRSDEARAKQAVQTLEVGELSRAEPVEGAEEADGESKLSRQVNTIGNAIGVILTALILIGMLLRALR